MVVSGGTGSLYIDNAFIASTPVNNNPSPPDTPNFVYFGDGSESGSSQTELKSFSYDFAPVADTQIVAISPAGVAGTVHVTVVTASGPTPTSPADQFTYYALAPVVSSVVPVFLDGGVVGATITGSNLSGITAVHFGVNNPANLSTLVYNPDGTITVANPNSVPWGSTVDVTVTTAGGTSPVVPLDQFWYGPNTPSIYLLNLKAGPISTLGVQEEIFGANLWNSNATVTFGGYAGTILSSSTTGNEMTVSVPPRESTGWVDVQVTTYTNRTSPLTAADHYTYTSGPVVTAVHLNSDPNAPAVGPTTGGTNLIISGYNLSDVNGVYFGGGTIAACMPTTTIRERSRSLAHRAWAQRGST